MTNLILPQRFSLFYDKKRLAKSMATMIIFYGTFAVFGIFQGFTWNSPTPIIIFFGLVMSVALLILYGHKKSFRCKMCNKHIRKRWHSLYCTHCRNVVKKTFEDWNGKIACNLCGYEFDTYASFENHFKSHSEKPYTRHNPEDNAIRKIT